MKIVTLGSPGVGKGTYTQDLVKVLGLAHISSGDLFRENIKGGTELGKKAQEFMKQGKLVPDELTIGMVKERLSRADAKKGFILDGFPRTAPQAEALDKIVKIDKVVNFKADKDIIVQRLSGRIVCRKCARIFHLVNLPPKKKGICDVCGGELYQREDDKPEAIRKRLADYEQQVAPLIAYYQKKGLLREITVNEEYGTYKEQIQARIIKVIKEKTL